MKWSKKTIRLESGKTVTAVSPLIVTASRATDIPAFFGEWFLQRLRAGYVKWINRFTGKPLFINLREVRLIVFWTKYCPPSFDHVLDVLDEQSIGYYFQFTVNDYEQEGWEPGLPSLEKRTASFRRISKRTGPEGIVWRVDPLLIADNVTPRVLLERIRDLAVRLNGYTHDLVFSFADIETYPRVKKNLLQAGVAYHEWQQRDQISFARMLADLFNLSQKPNQNTSFPTLEKTDQQSLLNVPQFNVTACAEEIDLRLFGIYKSKCVDDRRILNIKPDDTELRKLLLSGRKLKDPGQRKNCGCVIAKDIGSYATCGFRCLYCYAAKNP